MYCSKCGAQNNDDSKFCSACGAPPASPSVIASPTSQTVSPPPANSTTMPVQGKSALVAAILNLFWGLGYVYLGYKKVFGLSTVGFVIVVFIVYFIVEVFTFLTPFNPWVVLLAAVLLAIDGYQKGTGEAGFVTAQK